MIKSSQRREEKGIAVIAARGGSKRIPRKNIRLFHGKPIMEYVITGCLNSDCFAEVMVSTDDLEIAGLAEKAGATVPFLRSAANSGDHAGLFEVLREVIEAYAAQGRHFAEACCLLPTAPFVTAEKLQTAHNALRANPDCEMVVPVVRYPFPIQRAVRVKNDRLEMFTPEYFESRSQDLESAFHDAGQFYYFKTEKFLRTENPSFHGAFPLVCPESEVQDIDTEEDWKLAELKYLLQHKLPLP